MLSAPFDFSTLAIVVCGALLGGFTTGLAGFGTGLVASGLWYHALPATMVPPLVALASVQGQLIGLLSLRKAFNWPKALPYLIGGACGVPMGVALLTVASPFLIRTYAGFFLVLYSIHQLLARNHYSIPNWGGKAADAVVGVGGGFLGGFAGLSGPLPLIWLHARGGDIAGQRAVYQPFNLIVLALASVGMFVGGKINADVFWTSLTACPATMIGAAVGARASARLSVRTFQRIVLCLLLLSGAVLIGPAIF